MDLLYSLLFIVNGQIYVVDQHLTWADCHPQTSVVRQSLVKDDGRLVCAKERVKKD